MNLLEMVCSELGVRIDQRFRCDDGMEYKIKADGSTYYYNRVKPGWTKDLAILNRLVSGKLKPRWVPEYGEKYYIPHPTHYTPEARWEDMIWYEDEFDRWFLKNNMIFKTKEEAIDCATSMLDLAKHGI